MLLKKKGGKTVLQRFKGGYFHTLKTLFPELSAKLDISKFHKLRMLSLYCSAFH
jgi:hypothetical protein